MTVPERLKSRKFWVTVVAAVLLVFADALGIDREVSIAIVGAAASYVLGQGMVDAAEQRASGEKYAQYLITSLAIAGAKAKDTTET